MTLVNGRYRLTAGGNGGETVAAQDELLGGEVVLRLLPQEGPPGAWEDGLVERLHHPGLARVLECGRVETGPPELRGRRYLAREALGGATLREVLAAEGRLDVARLGRVALEALGALEGLHALGVVHGGLGPERILLTPEDGVKLCDSGLREASDSPYAAPELARGGAPDPRADLYALGACLYEAAAGRLPDRGSPQPLRELRPEVPAPLARAITQLVEPEPRSRAEGAAAARAAVSAALGLDVGRPAPGTLDPRFVGRAAAMDAIEEAVEEAQALAAAGRAAREEAPPGAPPFVLVSAGEGLGKSRLLAEAARRLLRRDVSVLTLEGFSGGDPYSSWRAPLERAAARAADADLARAALEAVAAGAAREAEARHERVARLLLSLATERPLALLVDDAHLLGSASAELLVHVARAAAAPGSGGALAVVAGGRPRDGARPAHLHRLLAAPLAPAHRVVTLAELAPAEARELAASLTTSAAEAEALAEQGGGSPFLLVELARERRLGGGTPASVQEALRARVERAGEEGRRLLEVLAILGRPARVERLTGLVEAEEGPGAGPEVRRRLRELEGLGLVRVEGGEERTAASLRHGVTRGLLLNGLDAERARRVARLALGTLEDDAPPGERARLALQARTDDAIDLALNAAEEDPTPQALYEGALELLEPGPRRAEIGRRLAVRLADHGAFAEARRALEAALLDLGDDPGPLDLARTYLELGEVAGAEGDTHEALEHASRGRQLLTDHRDAPGAGAVLARLHVLEARVATLRSDHAGAARLLARAKELARDPLLRARILMEEGSALVLSLDRTRYPEAREELETAHRMFEEAGDATGLLEALRSLGNHAYYAGQLDLAEDYFRRGLEAAERQGNLGIAAGLWNNVGHVAREKGELRRAEVALERSLDIAERIGQGSVLCRGYTNVGRLRRNLGDPRGAERSFRKAADVARATGDAMIESAALSELGNTRRAQGRTKAALTALGRSLRLRLGLGDPGRVAESELELAELWRTAGDVRAALGCTRRSLALMASLGDPDGAAAAVEAMEFAIGRPGGPAALLAVARRRLRTRGPRPVAVAVGRGDPLSQLALRGLAAALTARAGDLEQAETRRRQAAELARRIEASDLPAPIKGLARALELEAGAVLAAAAGRPGEARERVDEALRHAPPGSVRRGALLLKRAFLDLALDEPDEAVRDATAEADPAGLPEPLAERRAVGRALVVAAARRRGPVDLERTRSVLSLSQAQDAARRLGDVALLALVSAARAEEARLAGGWREAAWERANARIAAGRLAAGLPLALAQGLERTSAPVAAEEDLPPLDAPDQSALLTMLGRVLEAGVELERLLPALLDAALKGTGARRGFLALPEGSGAADGGGLELRAVQGLDRDEVDAYARRVAAHVLREGHPALIEDAAEEPRYGGATRATPRSLLAVPIAAARRPLAALVVDHPGRPGRFDGAHRDVLLAFAERLGAPLQASLQRAQEVGELSRLTEAYQETQRELGAEEGAVRLVGRSSPMRNVHRLIDRYGRTSAPVTIHGESGTGKELVAKALHMASPRRDGPFIALNCSAVTDTLLESELFGVVKGAFTGADRDRKGLFELAHMGTLFLDEVADMSLEMQAKLLRVLETGELRPVGGRRIVQVDVRIISASHQDLRRQVTEAGFREDLFYRLNVLRLELPPLRERREDIPLLAGHFLEKAARERGAPLKRLSPEALELLLRHPFPGNVRELQNALERACALEPGDVLGPDKLLLDAPAAGPDTAPAPAYHKTFLYQGVPLNRRQRQLLDHLSSGVAAITNREYCAMANVSERTGLRDLTHLVDQGLLERIGKRKGARYQLVRR